MTAPAWKPGTDYALGAVVQPASTPSTAPAELTNASFDSGDSGWTKGTGWTIETGHPFDGTYSAKWDGADPAFGHIINDDRIDVQPGDTVRVSCVIDHGVGASGTCSAAVMIHWYDSGATLIDSAQGDIIDSGESGEWYLSEAEGVAPSNAATFSVGCRAEHDGSADPLWADKFTLSYIPAAVTTGFIYEATTAGISGTTEPTWPVVAAATVNDGTVVWTARAAPAVVWTANPILESGSSEPTWPTTPGAMVPDGTLVWECITRRIEDENCPHSKVVAIGASKVFAGDGDIIRFCETVNPLNWSRENDAGYLPYGLQTYGANAVAAMGLYRGDLIAFNPEGMQRWRIDPDPSLMELIDALPIGSSHPLALAPVSNDLFLLTSEGVRTLGLAAGTTNLQAGAVGKPVDELVTGAMGTTRPILGAYFPGQGQYWLAFSTDTEATVYVYTMNRTGQAGAWSRYVYAFPIDAFAQLGDDLYIRSGDYVVVVNPDIGMDSVEGVETEFTGIVQWPWLDLGAPGVTKSLESFDLSGTFGAVAVQFGYDQRDTATFSTEYTLSGETLPGTPIPYPISAPSLSMRLTFTGAGPWSLTSANLYVNDSAGQP